MKNRRIGVLLIVGLLNACATKPCPPFDRYAPLKEGVDPYLSEDITQEGVEHLMCMAARGDKLAQFRLGHALENGVGIEADIPQAAKWYGKSANDTVTTNYVYQSGVGGRGGRVIPVGEGGIEPGLPEAQYALALLYLHGKGVRRDQQTAIRLLTEATESGHPDARALLQGIAP